MLALEPLGRCRPRSASCALPGATWFEVQNDLQLFSSCAGLGGAWERVNCEPALAAASAGPKAT